MGTKPDIKFNDLRTKVKKGINTNKVNTICEKLEELITLMSIVSFSGEYDDLINPPVSLTQLLNIKGALLTHNGTEQQILVIGSDNQVLTVDSNTATGLKWSMLATVANSGNYTDLINKPVEFYQSFGATKTEDYTVVQADHGSWIACSTNNITITLPSGLLNGTQIAVDRQGTQTVNFVTTGGATIRGEGTTIANQWGVVHVMYNSVENYWRLTGDL